MGKVKGILEENMAKHPELYNGEAYYEFWIECCKKKLIKKKNKPTIKKGRSKYGRSKTKN